MTTIMSTTQTLERNNETGLTESSQSSSASAERYRLDEFDNRPILLYKYRGGLQTSSQKDLCAWLDKGGCCLNTHTSIDIRRCSTFRSHAQCMTDRGFKNRDHPVISGRPKVDQCCSSSIQAAAKYRAVTSLPSHVHVTVHGALTDRAKDERLRVTKKAIPRYTSYVDVKRHDLYLPEEKSMYADYPNYDSNLACIKVPSLAYWSRLLLGNYQDLYIVSPESSPASSQADDDSKQTSPTSTIANENSDETTLGAMLEGEDR